MEKIRPRNQLKTENVAIESASTIYGLGLMDQVIKVNEYLYHRREDLLNLLLNNIDIHVRIYARKSEMVGYVSNKIIISMVNNMDPYIIMKKFFDIEDPTDDDMDSFTENVCTSINEYISSINDFLLRDLHIKNMPFNYVSRKVVVTPMEKTRLEYYEKLLEVLIAHTHNKDSIKEFIVQLFQY